MDPLGALKVTFNVIDNVIKKVTSWPKEKVWKVRKSENLG